jgi:hypothetical protein
LAALRHFNESTQKYELGYLTKDGKWAIEPGKIEYEDDLELPAAFDGFIYIPTSKGFYFYDHKGNLLHSIERDSETYDVVRILQSIQKQWPRN